MDFHISIVLLLYFVCDCGALVLIPFFTGRKQTNHQ